jgi:hypothetical protein
MDDSDPDVERIDHDTTGSGVEVALAERVSADDHDGHQCIMVRIDGKSNTVVLGTADARAVANAITMFCDHAEALNNTGELPPDIKDPTLDPRRQIIRADRFDRENVGEALYGVAENDMLAELFVEALNNLAEARGTDDLFKHELMNYDVRD